MTHTKSRPRTRGRWRRSRRKGRVWAETKRRFLQNGIKYLLVILERSEESRQRIRVLNTLFRLSYAGFFAKSHMMFFLLSSFRFCLPLKNDGRSELLCHDILMLNEYIKQSIENVSRPRMTGSKRTAFRGAKRRCKSEWDALPLG